MTSNHTTEPSEGLKPCPFCGEPLHIRSGVNSYGRCETEGCWMSERAITVPLSDPRQVAQWNTRARSPSPDDREGGETRKKVTEALERAQSRIEAMERDSPDIECPWQPEDDLDEVISTALGLLYVGAPLASPALPAPVIETCSTCDRTKDDPLGRICSNGFHLPALSSPTVRARALEEAAALVEAMPDTDFSYQRLWKIASAIRALAEGEG